MSKSETKRKEMKKMKFENYVNLIKKQANETGKLKGLAFDTLFDIALDEIEKKETEKNEQDQR